MSPRSYSDNFFCSRICVFNLKVYSAIDGIWAVPKAALKYNSLCLKKWEKWEERSRIAISPRTGSTIRSDTITVLHLRTTNFFYEKIWDKNSKKKVDVVCESSVGTYNKHISGLNLADILTELHRVAAKVNRWHLRIFNKGLDALLLFQICSTWSK